MYFRNLVGLVSLTLAAGLLYLLVPRERIRILLPYGIIFGAGLGVVLIAVMQNLLGYWEFRQIDFFTAGGIPLLIALAWLPTEILFAHFLIELRHPGSKILLWVFLGAAVAGLQYLYILNRMLTFQSWTLPSSFFLTLALHAGLTIVLHRMGYLRLQDLL